MGLFDFLKKEKVITPVAPLANNKTETHRIVGIQYHADSFMKLAVENPNYKLDKKAIISKKLTDQTIWEYNFKFSNVSLVEEPTNPHDPNAVQVIVDGVLIGYIKKGSCSHVKKLLRSGNITSTKLEKFNYGKYKSVYECCEEGHFEIDKGSSTGFAELKITYKEL